MSVTQIPRRPEPGGVPPVAASYRRGFWPGLEGPIRSVFAAGPGGSVARRETFAVMGIRGSGKTSTAKVLAEAMCHAGLPWIALDCVSVWWGIRRGVRGAPGYPVVVFGGEHGDLPLDRNGGKMIAEALLENQVSAVIDLSQESKRFWHTFVTDLTMTMMQQTPKHPTHLFVEESPEWEECR